MPDLDLKIRELENNRNLVRIIHYGCESWYSVKDRPTAVSCIAIVNLESGTETAYSLTDTKNKSEETLLRRYFDYLRKNPDAKFVHWNMNSSDFGFQAIEDRYRYLTGEEPPYSIPEERTFDLDDLMKWRYGEGFADHPKLYNLATINGHHKRHILGGKEEADKYEKGEYGDIKRSVTEKAHLIAFLTKRFLAGTVETKSSGPMVCFAEAKINSVQIVISLAQQFRDVSRQLLDRYGNRKTIEVKDEYDAQDLFHSMLRVFFDDVRKEEWTPSYAGGSNRIDFLIPDYKIAVELKHTRRSLDEKTLGEQLIIDAEKYKSHPDVRHLICIVFDKNALLQNPRGIEKDLTGVRGEVAVTVRIVDR